MTGPLALEEPLLPAEAELAAAGASALVELDALPELAPAEADLLTPPWPRQAPRPPCAAVVPSLQTTGPLALEEFLPEDPAPVAAGASELAELVELAPAEADLLTPPWPRQAPRPPCAAVVPSLQTTGLLVLVLCAVETAGAASSALANTALRTKSLSLTRFMCRSPRAGGAARSGTPEYSNPGTEAPSVDVDAART